MICFLCFSPFSPFLFVKSADKMSMAFSFFAFGIDGMASACGMELGAIKV